MMDNCTEAVNIQQKDVDEILRAELARNSKEDDDLWSSPRRNPREFAHSIFQYPAMMVPTVQKRIIKLVHKLNPHLSDLFDPYVGAGATITAGMSCGLNCYGQDINPLAVLVTKVKSDLDWIDDDLKQAYSQVISVAKADTSETIEVDFANRDKWFEEFVSVNLSRLRRAIIRQPELNIRRILWVTLAETIRLTSNDRTTTYKLHVRPEEEIKSRKICPVTLFESLSQIHVSDLIEFKRSLSSAGYIINNKYYGHINIELGDSMQQIPDPFGNEAKLFDLLVTSPPYGDNLSTITYGQHAYLPLQWIVLKDIDPKAEDSFLRTTQEIDRRSLGGHALKKKDLAIVIGQLSDYSDALADVFIRLEDAPPDRSARVASFYKDFIGSLDCILGKLSDQAYMIWTLGNRRVGGGEVPNDKILVELLERRRYHMIAEVGRTIYNKRMPHKNQITEMMRAEKIMIFNIIV